MLNVIAIPALADNYIWIVAAPDNSCVVVVDPGQAQPVLDHLEEHGLSVGAYLITHHHGDHTGGLAELVQKLPAPVYGPSREAKAITGVDHPVAGGDHFQLDCLPDTLEVIDVPGHTLGHIAYRCDDVLLAGDALFSAGCGRVFEGTHAQMQASLARLRQLPGQTRICCGHEYTQKNLNFAQLIEPDNPDIDEALSRVETLRQVGKPSLPSTLDQECRINPFLRWDNKQVIKAVSNHVGRDLTQASEIFGALRDWKNAN